MKLQATVVISYRADSFGDAGAGPVSLPYVESPPAPPRRVPHPLPDGDRT
jgi:hypothetical protein